MAVWQRWQCVGAADDGLATWGTRRGGSWLGHDLRQHGQQVVHLVLRVVGPDGEAQGGDRQQALHDAVPQAAREPGVLSVALLGQSQRQGRPDDGGHVLGAGAALALLAAASKLAKGGMLRSSSRELAHHQKYTTRELTSPG